MCPGSSVSGDRPPGSNPPWRGYVYRLALEGECRRGPRHFWSRRTHLKKGLVPHSSGRWDVQQIPMSRIQSRCCSAGIHFDRPCFWAHGSVQVCPGSGGSQSRPFDMDSGKSAFMSRALRLASSSLRGPSPQALTLLGGATFIVWCQKRLF